jgi:hypothetical protein
MVSLNMAKLALALQDRSLAQKHLAHALERKNSVIEKRVKADPLLDSMRGDRA